MKAELFPLDLQAAEALAAGHAAPLPFAAGPTEVVAALRDVASAQASLYRHTSATAPWIGYVTVDRALDAPVGFCSFKDVPRGGAVEIAYFTFPMFEGRGWGGWMANALAELAWREPSLAVLVAHTLPEESPSTRILRRLGFQLTGSVEDSEDGLVWRWMLPRPQDRPARCTS